MTTDTTLAALADAQRFLLAHPDVAACASVNVHPDGHWHVQLVKHIGDDDTRVGIIYGLAATYSGDVTRQEFEATDHVGTTITWSHDKTVDVFTAVAKPALTAESTAPAPAEQVTV